MRNLKKMLSLVMALAMIASFMVVGAGAQFSDDKDIVNKDAVETLVSLGVIKGRDTGAFDPAGIVTRAEMAKMICVAMAGGKDPTMVGTGMYPDTKNHWAAGYIDYCTNMGYVAGNTDGNFYPDKTVTGTEAAKMILTILGYNAETEKFVNDANWETNINAIASTRGIYDDVSVIPNQGLTRDNAAQMIYNGLQANMVKYDLVGIVGGNGVSKAVEITPNKTILNDKFNLNTGYSYLTGVSYDSDKKEYSYTLSTVGTFGSAAITGTDAYNATVKSTKDYSDLYGMKVRTLYKVDSNNKTTVYGIYASDSSVLASDVVGNISVKAADTSYKIDGTSYKLTDAANATPVYEYNNGAYTVLSVAQMISGTLAAANAYAYDLIDNTGDGKADLIVVHPVTVGKITFVGKDSITAGNVSYKFDDCNIYEGVAKDDYAVITPAANTKDDTVSIVKADKVIGDVEAQKPADNEYRVDGVWYTSAATPIGGALTINTGDNVELAVVNGYIYAAKVVEGTTVSDVLYVVDSLGIDNAASDMGLGGTVKGDDTLVLLPDGTKTTVKAMRVDTRNTSSSGTEAKVVPVAGLYTYSVNKDKIYELKAVKGATSNATVGNFFVVDAANQPSGSTFGTASNFYVKSTGKLDGKFIADDAVIYLVDTATPKYKTITGKELKTMQDYGTAATYLTKPVNGLTTVKVAYISAAAAFSNTDASTGYGYVTDSGAAEKNADKEWVVKFKVWNGTEEVTLTATDVSNATAADDATKYGKGAFITYTNSATTGEVTGVTSLETGAIAGGQVVAISGYDGDKNIEFYNGSATTAKFKDNDKTVVIFVNTADKKGIAGGSIELADKLASNVYTMNAVAKVTGGEVDVLFVDTANKLSNASYTVTTVTANAIGPANNVTYNSAVTKGDGTALSSGNALKGGESITVTVTPSGAATANGSKVITVTMTLADTTTIVKTMTFAETATVVPGAQSVNFSMPYQAVTSIVVS